MLSKLLSDASPPLPLRKTRNDYTYRTKGLSLIQTVSTWHSQLVGGSSVQGLTEIRTLSDFSLYPLNTLTFWIRQSTGNGHPHGAKSHQNQSEGSLHVGLCLAELTIIYTLNKDRNTGFGGSANGKFYKNRSFPERAC